MTLSVHQKLMATELCPAHCRACGGNSQPRTTVIDVVIVVLSGFGVVPWWCFLRAREAVIVVMFVVLVVLPGEVVRRWYSSLERSTLHGDHEFLRSRTALLIAFLAPIMLFVVFLFLPRY